MWAYQLLLHHIPGCLLSYPSARRLIVLFQGDLRRILRLLVSSLGLHPGLTFHSFRRSATSLARASGLSFQAIQSHWSTLTQVPGTLRSLSSFPLTTLSSHVNFFSLSLVGFGVQAHIVISTCYNIIYIYIYIFILLLLLLL
jgi:hypothetical protein